MKFLLMSMLVGLVGTVTLTDTPVTPWRDGVTSPRLAALEQQVRSGDAAAVQRFWAQVQRQHTPVVEAAPGDRSHLLVTFLYRAQRPITGVALISQLRATRDSAAAALTRLAGTDIWYKTYLLPADMRLSYSFVPNPTPQSLAYHSDLQLRDPLNPFSLPQGVNEGLSMLQLPAASPQPWIIVRRDVPAGHVEEMEVDSKILHAERRAWIYLPAGYDAGRTVSYPVLACFDGYVYSSPDWVPTPTILDNLIHARKIPPTIGVFIDQSPQPARNLELSNNPQFADFVATELMPAVRRKWRATADARQTIACGSSAGGLASLYIAFRHPEVFGNVLSQSAALWPGKTRDDPEHEWLTRQFETSPKLPLRFVIQVGDLEIGATPLNGPSILAANRHLRDVLLEKGYEVHYSEVAGGHEPITWRGGIAQGLMQLAIGTRRRQLIAR